MKWDQWFSSPARRRKNAVWGKAPESLEIRCVLTTALPEGFEDNLVANGLSNPTSMTIADDGRIFVTQQTGELRVIANGALVSTPVLSLSVDSTSERGLLGVALDPDFETNNYIYVYFTVASSPKRNRISRFTLNGNTVVAGSGQVIFDLPTLSAGNHNGGAIHFGADGKLYVATGDNAVSANSQSLTTTLGKILRINPDGSIPTDNPFYNTQTGNNRAIWAYGLRNPYTFAFQPGTDVMYINDVGQSSFEEINEGAAGANFGWPEEEGEANNPEFVDPIHAYSHEAGSAAITGGVFYNPATQQFPSDFTGDYFFADFLQDFIRVYDSTTDTATDFATGIAGGTVDLDVDNGGSLFYLSRSAGAVRRIAFTSSVVPMIQDDPDDVTAFAGTTVQFTVTATGAPTLQYQWQRNNVNIEGATSSTLTLNGVTTDDSGDTFRCIVTNNDGTATSEAATLTVNPNELPVGTIDLPTDGTTYQAGQTINFSGSGTDTEDGTLAASAFKWRVDFHKGNQVTNLVPDQTGVTSGNFVIPATGDKSVDVFYQIVLTVTDSRGASNTVTRDLLPETVEITVNANYPGLEVRVDGTPVTAAFDAVVGMPLQLTATASQTVSGVTYEFLHWEGSALSTLNITTPDTDTTYTAIFSAVPVLDQGGDNTLTVSRTSTGGLLSAAGTLTDLGNETLTNSQLVVTLSKKGRNKDLISIVGSGEGATQLSVNGTTVSYGGVAIGTITNFRGRFAVQFNDQATQAGIEATLKGLHFASKLKGTRPVSIQFQLANTVTSNEETVVVTVTKA